MPGTSDPMGAPHAADIAFKFHNLQTRSPFSGNRPERLVASRKMAEMWTSFARSGVPAAGWPPYGDVRRPMMRIDTACEVIEDRYRREREMWEKPGYIGGSG